MKITEQQLKEIAPNISDLNLRVYTPILNECWDKYYVNTKERICCFIAQIVHESGSFKYTREIASGEAYEGRKDLGNIYPGDGVKFKGRGLIQVTGRDNYRLCSLFLYADFRLIDNPEFLENPEDAVRSAFWYWIVNSLNNICDKPADYSYSWRGRALTGFEWLTKKINGGFNGLEQRKEFYERAKRTLQ
ncbi:MAG: glycoside hydrolase family 19 protein [Ignavibacteriales bacterium]|nr:MAG: glycoside hydrolase family 19 protein [Ignavibacteriales bacterium]